MADEDVTEDLEKDLEAARAAFRDCDWPTARDLLRRVRETTELAPGDLELLSDAAWWVGDMDEALAVGEEAYRGHLEEGRTEAAALVAVDLAVVLFLRGEDAPGSGWISRARRLVRDPEARAVGYLTYVTEVEAAVGGDDPGAVATAARRVRDIGERTGDPNLVATGTLGEGRALITQGHVERGLRLLDEAMLAVLSEELDPDWAGNVYCHLMAVCDELGDIRRASEWVQATSRWLARLPAAVLFTGICRVHRSRVLRITGEWHQAERETERVCTELADVHVAGVAEAHYQLGQLRRLRGELAAAEDAYRRARELGRDPQPGLALLCLARGDTGAAVSGIGAALQAAGQDRLARARLCAARVEIALADDDPTTARTACEELEATAAVYGTSGLEAAALRARGAVLLAEDRAGEALPALRGACRRWREVGAVHDTAEVRLLLARAYRALGDEETAGSELDAAVDALSVLGAGTELRRARELRESRPRPGGLTPREIEVLELVATGRTNREVADELVLSEKTVARHLSNIFTKIDVSTRTGAAAWAFEHDLVDPGSG